MSLRFLSLASGSSGNCYYIGNETYGLLIDAGIGIRTIKRVLKDHDIPMESIMGVLITHDHADHIKSAGVLAEKCNIPIYTTAQIVAGMNRNVCMREKLVSGYRLIEKEILFQIRDFRITAFEVPHDGSDNVGFFIEYASHRFAIATDLGYVPQHVIPYLKQANYLVLESNYDLEMLRFGKYPPSLKQRIQEPTGHLSNADAAEFLATHYTPALKYVFLCHISKDNNHPELAYKTSEMRLISQNVRVGKDLQLIALKRSTPSEFYCFQPLSIVGTVI